MKKYGLLAYEDAVWRRYVPAQRRFLQEPHGVIIYQKRAFFIVKEAKILYLSLLFCMGGEVSSSAVVRHILAANQEDIESFTLKTEAVLPPKSRF
jgi:hypothetical protein